LTAAVVCAIGGAAVLTVLTVLTGLAQTPSRAPAPAAEHKDLKIGKWKLRVAAPASGTREYEDRGCGITMSTRQGVNADGRPYFSQYAAQYDGKDYPRVVRGSQVANTIALRRVDEYTMTYTLKEDGKYTTEGTTVVSKDGKVLTVTTKRPGGGAGTPEVYDRVE
jgi:hypothetical protein